MLTDHLGLKFFSKQFALTFCTKLMKKRTLHLGQNTLIYCPLSNLVIRHRKMSMILFGSWEFFFIGQCQICILFEVQK